MHELAARFCSPCLPTAIMILGVCTKTAHYGANWGYRNRDWYLTSHTVFCTMRSGNERQDWIEGNNIDYLVIYLLIWNFLIKTIEDRIRRKRRTKRGPCLNQREEFAGKKYWVFFTTRCQENVIHFGTFRTKSRNDIIIAIDMCLKDLKKPQNTWNILEPSLTIEQKTSKNKTHW